MRSKMDELQCGPRSDILVLVETWLYESETPFYNIKGYSAVHSCRDTRGGGAAIYIANSIKFSTIDCSDSDQLFNWVCISFGKNNLKLSVIYRPPSYNGNIFLNDLEAIINKYKTNHIILGDMNINLLNDNSLLTKEYKELISINRFMIVNSLDESDATRVTESTSSIIDHVLCTGSIKCRCKVKVEDTPLSDHKKVILTVKEKLVFSKQKVCIQKQYLNTESFNNIFKQKIYNLEINTFQELIEVINKAKQVSQTTKLIKCHVNNNWVTPDLIKLIKYRDNAYKCYKKNPDNIQLKANFRSLKNSVNNQIKILKNKFFRNKWQQAGENSKKQWNIINSFVKSSSCKDSVNELEIDGKIVTDTHIIADTLNTHFSQIGLEIVKEIETEKKNIVSDVILNEITCDNSIYLELTNELEIGDIIMNLKRGAAPGKDGITVENLINIKENIVKILTVLVNDVLTTGIFPEELKIVKICPIFKSGLRTSKNNYRPISLISVFSKIIEIIIKKRFMSFMNKYITPDPYQYGFTNNSSTLGATADLISSLSGDLDRGNIALAVFIDLRKAFDVVDHSVLLSKLQNMGFRGVAFDIIKSYLSNRKQYITLGDCNSDMRVTNCGVPQGSVLGPLLYTLFVLSLRLSGLQSEYYTFADDTVLIYKSKTSTDLENKVNTDLKQYYTWLLQNKLKINIDKTRFIIFKQKNKVIDNIHIQINNISVEKANKIKYLGLVLDDQLNWGAHIDHIKDKIISLIGALYRCRHFLSINAKYKIYNAYFLSIIRYLIPVWGTCNQTNFNKIKILQNKVLKILFNLDYYTHTDTIYQMLKLQPVNQILMLEQSKLIFKILNNRSKCNSRIQYVNQIHDHYVRGNDDIRLASARTNKALCSPISAASGVFNSLPLELKNERRQRVFVNKLKNHIYGT